LLWRGATPSGHKHCRSLRWAWIWLSRRRW
jgi:hypothetical protein